MKLLSLLTAALVTLFLYALVLERDALRAFASGSEEEIVQEDETPTFENLVSVVALKSTAQSVENAILLRGETEASRQVVVSAETSGRVISDPIRKGAFVETGQLLCELDPGTRASAVAEAVARVSEARAREIEAGINLNAAERLGEGGFASETRVASAQAAQEAALAGIQAAEAGVAAAQKEIERLQIRAPFAGLLESDTAELGTLMQPGAACATVIQLDPVKIVGFVPETDVAKISLGALAGARLTSGRELTGMVSFLSRSSDPQTRTFRVEIEMPNADFSILDGQTAEILIASSGSNAHLMPGSALTLSNDGTLGVRIVDADNIAQFTPVEYIRDTPEGIWLGGLADEVTVIVEGQEYVGNGEKVDVHFREVNQ
ncbi:efflux RND transporter periplasmic adaptor subunit [Halocynthiibacter namhaensis]|uniref:efflux RND transporter periplasmic adaptor subunit n=1 Tax=Halocynthiibacter namhaensis TaxID=1290553 RepID=UPI00057963E0|nr:efflux RND transporter periplasmic adaptor subunit [Halocynthiibacter namhaensis]